MPCSGKRSGATSMLNCSNGRIFSGLCSTALLPGVRFKSAARGLLSRGPPLAAAILLGDGERPGRRGKVGDDVEMHARELEHRLVDVGPHELHLVVDAACRLDL